MFSLGLFYVFIADKSVKIETLYPSMHRSETTNNINLIQGTFDISKWIRPIEFGVEVLNDNKIVKFKRGDVLFYIRFLTDEKINLERIPHSNDLNYMIYPFTNMKKELPNQPLEKVYKIAEPWIKLIKKKLFKSKCPFH